jgi:3-oxoacyl-[acyl-carrier-protein] synthase II
MRAEREPRRRVAVTGLGVVSSIGTGTAEFAAALRAGRSGVRPITAFDVEGFAYANACEVPDFEPGRWITRLDPDRLGRATQLAVACARLALADAGLTAAQVGASAALISVGTTYGESGELDRIVRRQVAAGTDEVDESAATKAATSRLSIDIARELALADAEAVTIPTACAAGNYAIGYGFDAVAAGEADVALCGGADALLRMTFVTFYRLGTVAPDVCRPFDRGRKGILTGEGGAILVLEPLDAALARGAHVYAEVLGYGLACDALHPVAPDRDSVARCMRVAHADAGITAEQVDYISAHGTGTKANDVTEAAAVRQVFGAEPPPVSSLKSMLGHTMGAASALAAAGCALALDGGFMPPTVHHTEADPEIGLDCVPNAARDADLRVVQNNSLAFAGNDAVLLLGRYEDGWDRPGPGGGTGGGPGGGDRLRDGDGLPEGGSDRERP